MFIGIVASSNFRSSAPRGACLCPQSLQALLRRLCWQMLVPPQSLQSLLGRLCWQMLGPPQSLQRLLWQLCSHLPRPRCCALTLCRCLPSLPPVGRILRLKILESFLGSISGDAKGTMFQDIQHFQSLHGQAGLGHHVGFKIPIPHGHHHRKHHHGGNCYPHKSW